MRSRNQSRPVSRWNFRKAHWTDFRLRCKHPSITNRYHQNSEHPLPSIHWWHKIRDKVMYTARFQKRNASQDGMVRKTSFLRQFRTPSTMRRSRSFLKSSLERSTWREGTAGWPLWKAWISDTQAGRHPNFSNNWMATATSTLYAQSSLVTLQVASSRTASSLNIIRFSPARLAQM